MSDILTPAVTERDLHLNMVFTTAVEGGINYWAAILEYRWCTKDGAEARDFYADVADHEDDGKTYRVTRQTITSGIRRALAYMAAHGDTYDTYQRRAVRDLSRGKWDDADYDSTTADIIVQFGLFGELIYG